MISELKNDQKIDKRREGAAVDPLRYRLRAKLLYQSRMAPYFIRRYLRQEFPTMCRATARTGGK